MTTALMYMLETS